MWPSRPGRPVSHICSQGVPRRIGLPARHGAQGTREAYLYFAASIITWVDEEARAKDSTRCREGRSTRSSTLRGEREQAGCSNCAESLSSGEKVMQNGNTDERSYDADHLWAALSDIQPPGNNSDEGAHRSRSGADEGPSTADIADIRGRTSRIAAGCACAKCGSLFKPMEPQQDRARRGRRSASLRALTGASYGFQAKLPRRIGRGGVRDREASTVDLDAKRVELEEQVNDGQRPEAGRGTSRTEVVSAVIQFGQHKTEE